MLKKFFTILTVIFLLLNIILFALRSYAFDANILVNPPNQLNNMYPSNQMQAGEILEFIIAIRNFILFLGVALFIIFVVIAGIKYMGSGGDEAKIEEARKNLIYAIVGGIITFSAFIIMQAIISFIKQSIDFNSLF